MKTRSFAAAVLESVVQLQEESCEFERLDLPAPSRLQGRDFCGQALWAIDGSVLSELAKLAFHRLQFGSSPELVEDLKQLTQNPEASKLDRFVGGELLRNAAVAARGQYPACQDTGTAAVFGWKGDRLLVSSQQTDADLLEKGMLDTWQGAKLRNSQLLASDLFTEHNSGTNAPLVSELFAEKGDYYRLVFTAKGGGSSNKTRLYQETKAVLSPDKLAALLLDAVDKLGVSACPPYTIAVVIGGQSPEQCLLAVKLAGMGMLDALPEASAEHNGIFRDRQWEASIMGMAAGSGWGAQFGGTALARAVRLIRLPRHAASLTVGLGVSCVAHRQIHARIDQRGIFLQKLAFPLSTEFSKLSEFSGLTEPPRWQFCPDGAGTSGQAGSTGNSKLPPRWRELDLDNCSHAELEALRAGETLCLSGSLILARDAVHSRLRDILRAGGTLPDWTKLPAYYASPTETPVGAVIGSLGPTTARRMDDYCAEFLAAGIFPVMLGKGERGEACRAACQEYKGLYLAAVGGAAALGTSCHITENELLDWPDLGMEAVRRVRLADLPVVVIIDSRGVDFYLSRQNPAGGQRD